MSLTPLDIQHKEFPVKIKGYDKEQVNDFLDNVTKEFEEIIRQNKDLQKPSLYLPDLHYCTENPPLCIKSPAYYGYLKT